MTPREIRQRRWLRSILSLLVAVLAALTVTLGVTTASASAAGVAETRVGAISLSVEPFVGPPQHVSAGQRLGSAENPGQVVVATGVAANSGATNFVGRKAVTKHFDDGSSASYGGEINIARGTNAPGVVNGRAYSGHAFDQMQGRGVTPSVVDDAIGSGVMSRGADASRIFYSSENNISVVLNSDGRVITVGYGAFKPR